MAEVETRKVDDGEEGMRLDRWFAHHFPALSFGHLQKLLRSGQVRVDGGRARSNTRLATGQTVRVPPLERTNAPTAGQATSPAARAGDHPRAQRGDGAPPDGRPTAARPKGKAAKDADALRAMLLHEDDKVFVFNKPPGLAVQGGSGLTTHIDAMLESLTSAKGEKPRLVHRLDRDTSGVLVVARTRLAASKLAASFRQRSSRKVYWALVAGVPKPRQGRISTYLAKAEGPEGDRMRIARHGDDDASHAVSLYSVVETAGQKLAWLTMRPVTGRTHQLRAHAAHIGHPIVGDPKYFDLRDWELPGGLQNKLHLLARRIVMPHPDGGVLDVTAPLPPHMQQSWNLLGFTVDAAEEPDADED
ncbi:MAG: RluA family pseudouridine synthase [Bauldia sp.]|nr:RluA family pseudouridine synthase [Bauldia sp.]